VLDSPLQPSMFNFLKRRREAAQRASIEAQRAVIIADCERALDRISRAGWEFVGAQEVASHIAKANAVGLLKHETVARLELLQRLNAAALENPGPTVNDNLLTEAARLGLEDTSAARFIRRRRRLEVFRERGQRLSLVIRRGVPSISSVRRSSGISRALSQFVRMA
jgi:hypothetical protein